MKPNTEKTLDSLINPTGPEIILIAAMAQHHVIGLKGRLPWDIPEDLSHFRQLTTGYPVVMGHRTWLSLHLKPLPNRWNIVLSRHLEGISNAEVTVCRQLEEVFKITQNQSKIFIIGGQHLYDQMLPYAHKMELTEIDAPIPGDTYFPVWDPKEWQLTQKQPGYSDHFPFPFYFNTYVKKP